MFELLRGKVEIPVKTATRAELEAAFRRAPICWSWNGKTPKHINFSVDKGDNTPVSVKFHFADAVQYLYAANRCSGYTYWELAPAVGYGAGNTRQVRRKDQRGAQSVAVAPPVVRRSVAIAPKSVEPAAREHPKKIVIDDAFIRGWEPRYDRIAGDEPEYRRLVNAVAREIARTGTISKETFLDIWKWKGAMRVIRHVRLEEYDTRYAESFRRAVSAPPQRRLYLLIEPSVKLPGVEVATGSTLLHFMDPETMPIIDVRTIGVLFAAGLISTDHKDLEHYEEFRQAIHGIKFRCPGWNLRQVDRALFAYHTEVLD